MADRRPVETLVERDDGVVFAMRGAGGGADLPHDLVHAVVETELRIVDGVWGCVADGVVWGSMRHVSGRRPPHAEERSNRLKRERAGSRPAGRGRRRPRGAVWRDGAEVLGPARLSAAGIPAGDLAAAVGRASGPPSTAGPPSAPGATWHARVGIRSARPRGDVAADRLLLPGPTRQRG